jgi:CheY-like chemotaxis protein
MKTTKILVIEDNADNRFLITYLLRASGYEPMVATNGFEGLAMAKQELPDLVLCDIHMPNKSGYDVACDFKSNPNLWSVPLVAITSYAMVGDRELILASGFDMYVAKPIDPETFVHEIECFFNRHSIK